MDCGGRWENRFMTVDAGLEGLFEVEPGEVRAAVPAGAAKTFRGYDQGQSFLLPPSLDDWLDPTCQGWVSPPVHSKSAL